MAYTAQKPGIRASSEQLRQRIPGWGVDLDPADRPSYPKEIAAETGARWDFPVRQQPRGFRERSTEHKFLTPVFGTAQPLKGISGQIRKHAYTYSEGRLAHWLLLVAGDRVDVLESRISTLLKGRPDNVIAETGVLSEFKNRAYRTRFGQGRVDLKHQPIDLVMWAAPYLAIAGAIYMMRRGPAPQRRRRLRPRQPARVG